MGEVTIQKLFTYDLVSNPGFSTEPLSDEELRRIEMKKKQELRLKKLKRILDEDDNK